MQNEGVKKFYLPAIDSDTTQALLNLEKKFPGKCVAMTGLHPCSVKENYKEELKLVERSLAARKFVAIGEIGLDFYWDRSFVNEQYLALHEQMEWALHYDLPIVLHSREAIDECIRVVEEHQRGNLKGVFHCFTGSLSQANQIIGLGFYLGIGGVLTFKNSGLDKAIAEIDLSHIVLETDAPYLAPVPYRGKRNECGYLLYVAQKLAELKGGPVNEIDAITTDNASKLFGL